SITPAEAAAALKAVQIVDSAEGLQKQRSLRILSAQLRDGLVDEGFETLASEHPIVPVFIRDTARTGMLVQYLFAHKILATGLTFPIVPNGEEEIRFQVSASHTEQDIDYLLQVLNSFR
ncbi:MAG: aminotransferase class I/II-fold pyridoxal phosphate-dependent enzyme, partial [Methylococcales bacterium]